MPPPSRPSLNRASSWARWVICPPSKSGARMQMISGKRAFHGETAADTMSAILKEEPPELAETALNVPPALERIVRHCLEKNPAQRFHSISDVAFGLEVLPGISSTTTSRAQRVAPVPQRR